MAVAISAAFILPDLPTNSRGFTEEELYVARLRMTEDVGEADVDSEDQGALDGLKMALKDPKTYLMMITLTAYVIGLSFNAFFPTLTATLGFSYVPTLLMSAPPWVFACIVSLINALHADRCQERFWHIVGPVCVGLVGFVISMSTENVAARYIALFLQASSYAGFIVFYSWISSSFPRPPAKRAVAIAMINAFSQLGNVSIASAPFPNLKADRISGCWKLRLESQPERLPQELRNRHSHVRPYHRRRCGLPAHAHEAEQEALRAGTSMGDETGRCSPDRRDHSDWRRRGPDDGQGIPLSAVSGGAPQCRAYVGQASQPATARQYWFYSRATAIKWF